MTFLAHIRAAIHSRPKLVAAFDPAALAPLTWWDTSSAQNLEIDSSGNVRRWFDKSQNGRHLFTSDASAARRLKYYSADDRIGGKSSVAATAANQLLQTALEAGDGTPASYNLEIREIYVVTMYSLGTQTQFNRDNNVAGWGPGAIPGSNDGYASLIGGVVNGATGGNPRFMGNLNTGRVIGTSAINVDGAFRNRDTFLRGSGDTSKPLLLPLPLSVLRIPVTSTAITAARVIGNMDVGSARAWSGPICEMLTFTQPPAEADRNALVEHLIAKWGIVV